MTHRVHKRKAIRNEGTVKKRRNALCALEMQELKDLETMALLLVWTAILEDEQGEEQLCDDLFVCGMMCTARHVDISRDIRSITEPVERKYLSYHSPEISTQFTAFFRFRRECLTERFPDFYVFFHDHSRIVFRFKHPQVKRCNNISL